MRSSKFIISVSALLIGTWRILLISALALLVSGCATGTPTVWLEKGSSFAGYQTIEVPPILNETDSDYEFDAPEVITTLHNHMTSGFESKGYLVPDVAQEIDHALVIQTHLLLYRAGSAFGRWLGSGMGKAKCTIKSVLVDKKTGHRLGEIMSAKEVSEGGLFSVGADSRILETVAMDVVEEVDRILKRGQKGS